MKALGLLIIVLLTGCSNGNEVDGVQKAIDALQKGCNKPNRLVTKLNQLKVDKLNINRWVMGCSGVAY